MAALCIGAMMSCSSGQSRLTMHFDTESASRPLMDFDVLSDNLIKELISCVKYMSRF
jgi:hypothetical protein